MVGRIPFARRAAVNNGYILVAVALTAGGFLRAYVETVNVEITDGKLDITFTANVENPQINGIEIIPAS